MLEYSVFLSNRLRVTFQAFPFSFNRTPFAARNPFVRLVHNYLNADSPAEHLHHDIRFVANNVWFAFWLDSCSRQQLA
jgi:hypothetical protein